MAINFPNSPTDGQVYTEEGSSWTYRTAKQIWEKSAFGGAEVPITESTIADSTGYCILGDVMFQWGTTTGDVANGHVVTFAVAFSSGTIPTITTGQGVIGNTDSDRHYPIDIVTQSSTGFTTKIVQVTGTAVTSSSSRLTWMAVGLAPTNLRKPETVVGVPTP